MRRSSLTAMALGVFGLVLLAFVLRGFGQFLLGPRRAMLVAGPVALLAVGLLLVVLAVWSGARLGLIAVENGEDDR